jgi:hypothetical protein
MTEDEAKTKWCPHARVLDGSPPGGAGVNRKGPEAGVYCIASGCMAWRWSYSPETAEGNDVEPEGYCGLAGKP